MWIEQLDVKGFKRLDRRAYRFGRGLTVVWGPNEAGKSSLREAVVRALFGFSRQERTQRAGGSVLNRCAPWRGDDFGVAARVHRNGDVFRIEWDFSTHAVRLLQADTGDDLSQRVRRARNEVELGRYLLKIGLDEFRQVCCLDQAAIAAVERSEDLVVALRQSVETGTVDGGVERAQQLLNEALRSDVGVRVDTLKPVASGRLRRLHDRREELEHEIDHADNSRQELQQLAGRQEQLAGQRFGTVEKLTKVEQRLLRSRLERLESRLRRARELKELADFSPPPGSDLGKEQENEIRGGLSRIDHLKKQIAALEPQAEAAQDSIAGLDPKRADLTLQVDGLEAYRTVDNSAEAQVRDLVGRRAGFQDQLGDEAPAVFEPDPMLARYRSERARLAALGTASRPHWKYAWILAFLTALISVAAGALVHPVAFAGLLLSIVLAGFARKPATAGSLLQALSAYGASSLEELEQRVTAEDQRRAQYEAAQVAKRTGEERRKELNDQLVELLDRVGIPDSADGVDRRAAAYLEACKRRTEWVTLVAELERTKNELAAVKRPVEQLAELRQGLAECSEQLLAQYKSAAIDEPTLEAARSLFEERVVEASRVADGRAKAGTAAQALQGVLEGSTIEQLDDQREQAEQRLREHIANHDELTVPGDDVQEDELESLLTELNGELKRVDLDLRELDTQVSALEAELPEIAALREEAETVKLNLIVLTEAAEAIAEARKTLEEAARESHRTFAPHLNRALKENLSLITEGRYGDVAINEDLDITLVAPETDTYVPATVLSRGTQDQIYFVERLEIARLLDPTTGEAPLLLDDPFVHFDEKRLASGLEILGSVAAERQVILFTVDDKLAERARETCSGCETIELERGAPEPPATPVA
jgi:DNA repair exonuclease SbcCD ATPase subunit